MISQLRQQIVSKKISAAEIAKEYLKKAKSLNKRYNSFVSSCDELALESAKAVDKKVKEKKPLGKLAGVPIAVKDNILVKGYPATAGSKMLEHYTASYDADAVKFLKEEGAIIIGKTNLDEFAMGSSSETSAFGRVKSNISEKLVPGGSSGGSAVAVASGQVPIALGSDTGGSIRQPASFTGTIGLKPTYGRVSRSGLIAMASSLDQIGTFTTSIGDAGLLLEIISQETSFDATYGRKDFHFILPDKADILDDLKDARIGVPKEYFGQGLDGEIKDAVNQTLARLSKLGTRIERISLPSLASALACYYIIMPAEVSSNLARYDAMRYGALRDKRQTTNDKRLEEVYAGIRGAGFGKEVRRRIILGTYVLSAGYIDKYYLQAQKVRARILLEFKEAFRSVDIIAGPTSPMFPFKAGEKLDDPLSMYLADIYTVAPNLAGLPAISIPLRGTKLPTGLQLVAPHFEEERLLILAEGIELVTRFVAAGDSAAQAESCNL
ncbi:MAG: Asp-tRNA(Asn)/Glu-tRNA(Gln) amidotransferase subunit GatA [Candidatus Portnoybacteria bacterium]|nr:Asp-tRNA(Asn)/Glu-tRNA(Gln) amidotransferase subunit GatA [Candidatus Portnoybacteria bacterium]